MPDASVAFPLYDLNKVCLLAVAEQLDHTGRRYLSQTCQRFRRLLIPNDRYIHYPKSYWDETSLDKKIIFKKSRMPTTTDTRRPLHTMKIQQFGSDQFMIKLIKDFRGMADIFHTLQICNQGTNEEARGLYRDDGKLRTSIIGEFPAIIHEIIEEINRYCVFQRYIMITITSPRFIRLPLMIHLEHECSDIPMFVDGKVIGDDMPEEAVCKIATDYKDRMPAKSCLTLKLNTAYDKEQAKATTLTTLKALKHMWRESSETIKWEPCVKIADDYFRDPISMSKTKEKQNTVVVRYNGNFENLF